MSRHEILPRMLINRQMRRRYLFMAMGLAVCLGMIGLAVYNRWTQTPPTIIPDSRIYPVRGIDVSAHNGDIDFARVKAAGTDFIYFKATEGMTFKDKKFRSNLREARKAGLLTGAYHFFRFDRGGYEQALNLLHSVKGEKLDLPLAIDLEEWTNPKDRTTSEVMARLQTMILTLENQGYKVIIYSNRDGFYRFLDSRFAHYHMWLSSLSEKPETSRLRIWQYTHSGKVDGVNGSVDQNVFVGSRREWDRWLSENLFTPSRSAQ